MLPPKKLNQPVIIDAMELAAEFISAYVRALKENPDFASVEPVDISSIKLAAKQILQNKTEPEILESIKIARIVIVQAGRPLMLDELYEYGRARGLRISTKNPKGAFGKRLMRHGKVENLVFKRGYGWWPAELQLPNESDGGQSRN